MGGEICLESCWGSVVDKVERVGGFSLFPFPTRKNIIRVLGEHIGVQVDFLFGLVGCSKGFGGGGGW